MNKKELAKSVVEILKDNNVAKNVKLKKHTFYITDDEGHKAAFDVRGQSKDIPFTVEDVTYIIDAIVESVYDALKDGQEIVIKGFGSMSLEVNKAHKVTHPVTNEPFIVPARYFPRVKLGENLRLAAKMYTLAHPIEGEPTAYGDEFDEFGEEFGG